MPTTLPRINCPFNRLVFDQITRLAKVRHVSTAEVVRNLTEEALELQEDIYWAKLADEAAADPRPGVKLEDLRAVLAQRRAAVKCKKK